MTFPVVWFHLPWLFVISLLSQSQFALIKASGILGVSASNLTFCLLARFISWSLPSPSHLPQSLSFPSHSLCTMFMYYPAHHIVQFLVKSVPMISSPPLPYVTWISGSSQNHLALRSPTLAAQAPVDELLRKKRGADVRFDPKQKITGQVLNLSAHTPLHFGDVTYRQSCQPQHSWVDKVQSCQHQGA